MKADWCWSIWNKAKSWKETLDSYIEVIKKLRQKILLLWETLTVFIALQMLLSGTYLGIQIIRRDEQMMKETAWEQKEQVRELFIDRGTTSDSTPDQITFLGINQETNIRLEIEEVTVFETKWSSNTSPVIWIPRRIPATTLPNIQVCDQVYLKLDGRGDKSQNSYLVLDIDKEKETCHLQRLLILYLCQSPWVVQLYNVSLVPTGNPRIKSQSQLNKEKDTMSMKLI